MVEANAHSGEFSGSTPYRRLFDLAEGGMGRVELTVRRGGKFQRLYAVKRLHATLSGDDDARSMFVEEGRLAGLIHHPNVVGVLDVGEDARGPFLAMEYVEGVTARDVLRHAHREGLPIPCQIACRIIAQAAHGLANAHGLTSHDGAHLHLVHRDVSPHNILIGFDGVVRVADFGIARATGRDHRTSTGVLKGKLGYMPPEVLQFQDADARSDLFSLGVVLYELLAGQRLYGGSNDGARARRILEEPPPDIGERRTDVPPDVQALLVALLAKDRADRPADARHVAERLDAAVHDMVEAEGAHPLEEYVREGFWDTFEERRRAIQRALDALEEPDETRSAPRPRGGAGRRGVGLAIAASLALAGLAAVGLLWPRTAEPAAEPADRSAQAPPPESVSVSVTTSPPGARVQVDGAGSERTPTTLELPRGDAPVELSIRLQGYAPRTETVTPNQTQRLELMLTPSVEEPASSAAPSAPSRPARSTRRRRRRAPEAPEPSSLDDFWGAAE